MCSRRPAAFHLLTELPVLGPQPSAPRWSPWLLFAREKPLPELPGDRLTPEQQSPCGLNVGWYEKNCLNQYNFLKNFELNVQEECALEVEETARWWLSHSKVWVVAGPEVLPLLVLFLCRTLTDTPRELAAFIGPALLPENPSSVKQS